MKDKTVVLDALGNPIKIGDIVAYSYTGSYNNLKLAKVESVDPNKKTVSIPTQWGRRKKDGTIAARRMARPATKVIVVTSLYVQGRAEVLN